jgi:hypothetical protein
MNVEINMEKIGVVFTKTVAFRRDVSFTAEMNKMKWTPKSMPSIRKSLKFLLKKLVTTGFLRARTMQARAPQAIISLQRAMDKTFIPGNNRMNIAAVPKRKPAVMPSSKAVFLLLITRQRLAYFSGRILLTSISFSKRIT